MFADLAKMAVKIALIAVITATIIAVFAVTIPSPDLSPLQQALGKGLAFVQYWVPNYMLIWNFFKVLLALQLAILALRGTLIAYRWVMKVNE